MRALSNSVLNIIVVYGVSAPLQTAPKRKINADVHHTVEAVCEDTQHDCTIVMREFNTVIRDQDQSKGKMLDYDTNAFAIRSLLESLQFLDCGRMGKDEQYNRECQYLRSMQCMSTTHCAEKVMRPMAFNMQQQLKLNHFLVTKGQ